MPKSLSFPYQPTTSRPNVIRKTASNSGVLPENYLGQHIIYDSNKRETVTVTHSTKCEDVVNEPHDQTSDHSGQTSGDLFRPQVIAAVSRVHNTQSVNDKRQADHEAANLASYVQVIDSTSQSSGSDVTPTVPSQVATPIQTEGMHNMYGTNVSEPSVMNNNYFLPYTIANAHIIMHLHQSKTFRVYQLYKLAINYYFLKKILKMEHSMH